ncbi:hypothetical protein Tco_0701096 [Tanacetum coccineum]
MKTNRSKRVKKDLSILTNGSISPKNGGGLWYPKGSGFELTAFSDADHAGCIDTRKSTSGGIQFLRVNMDADTASKIMASTFNKIIVVLRTLSQPLQSHAPRAAIPYKLIHYRLLQASALRSLEDWEVSSLQCMQRYEKTKEGLLKVYKAGKGLLYVKRNKAISLKNVTLKVFREQIISKGKILGIDQLTEDTSSSGPKDPVFVKSSADNSEVSITGSNKPKLSETEDSTLSNHDTGKSTDPLPLLEKLTSVEPVSGTKTIKSILKSKSTFKVETLKVIILSKVTSSSRSKPSRPAMPFPSCIHCGYNDHQFDDYVYYPICEICGSYDHDTHGHNMIISLEEEKRKSPQAKKVKSFKASKTETSSALRSKTPTKRWIKQPKRGVSINKEKDVNDLLRGIANKQQFVAMFSTEAEDIAAAGWNGEEYKNEKFIIPQMMKLKTFQIRTSISQGSFSFRIKNQDSSMSLLDFVTIEDLRDFSNTMLYTVQEIFFRRHQSPGLDDRVRTISALLLAEIDKRNLNPLKQMRII